MNGLQSGTPASELSRQSFKNSNQSGSVQGTYNSSNLLYSDLSNQSLNATNISLQLKVVDNSEQTSILGVSAVKPIQKTNTKVAVVSSPYNFIPSVTFIFIVGLACLAIYFKVIPKTLAKKTEN